MNILQIQDQLKNLSQDQLVREMQMPSGSAPQYLVLSELTRRKKMQTEMAAQQQKGPQQTVAQEAVAAAGVPQAGLPQLAAAMAPKTDITGNTGAMPAQQILPEAPVGMADGGYVQRMQVGGFPTGDTFVQGGKVYTLQPDGTYLSADGADRILTPGQSVTSDLAGMGAGLTSIRDYLHEAAQPEPYVGPNPDFMTGDYTVPAPMPGPFTVPSFEQTGRTVSPTPPPLSYIDIITQAQGGVRPTASDLERSAEGLTTQQAADVQAMVDDPTYIPEGYEINAAVSPGLTPVEPYLPNPDTPYQTVKNAISDTVLGIFDGRTLGEQQAIDAERAAAIEAYKNRMGIGGPAFETQGREQSPTTPEEAAAAAEAARKATEDAAKTATDTPDAPTGGGAGSGGSGGSGGASGLSSYEQEITDAIARSEKRAEQDKWLALAQTGLEIMNAAAKQGTFAGAVGEGGTKGLAAFRQGRDEAEATRLGLLKELEGSRLARAQLAARGGGGGSAKGALTMNQALSQAGDLMTQGLEMEQAGIASKNSDLVDRGKQLQVYANSLIGMVFPNSGGGTGTIPAP